MGSAVSKIENIIESQSFTRSTSPETVKEPKKQFPKIKNDEVNILLLRCSF